MTGLLMFQTNDWFGLIFCISLYVHSVKLEFKASNLKAEVISPLMQNKKISERTIYLYYTIKIQHSGWDLVSYYFVINTTLVMVL